MTKHYLPCALATSLLLSFACAAVAQSDNASASKDAISATDTVFIQNAATGNLAEIEMGKMAVSKSSNDKVKALAQHIVDDHTKANDALKALAESKKVSFPSAPTKDAQKQNDSLQAKNGDSFDEAWSKAMVQDHQDAIKMFAKEAKQTKDTDIQQFVKTTTPALKSHLGAAQQLAAVPDARDKAMDQSTKSMNSAMDSAPAAAATAATPSATPQSTAVKAPAAAPTTAPSTTPGAKH